MAKAKAQRGRSRAPAKVVPTSDEMTGAQFKAAREQLGMTLAQLAGHLGYPPHECEPGGPGIRSVSRWQVIGPPRPAQAHMERLLRDGVPKTLAKAA
jgi:transcriptional regulator with XRE-family HTH domain